MHNKPNLDFVNINLHMLKLVKKNPSINSQDIERKQNSDIHQGP